MNVLDWFRLNNKPQVSANVSVERGKFYVGVLVEHVITREIGIVTKVTHKWVHVTWLAASDHENSHYERKLLNVCSRGTRVVVKQK
jgi:hypothetical protein